VLGGQDLVIKGPPGTGKSQTISNLIACLVARGKTVLFVAEKRAAIDAVLKRLERVGLHDLVLDLHGGVSSKRQVAQSLAHALHTNATIAEPDLSHDHQRLEARRRELNEWKTALHRRREPWGLSLFDAEEVLLALPAEAETDVRVRGEKLHALTADGLERAREQLREFVGLAGCTPIPRRRGPALLSRADRRSSERATSSTSSRCARWSRFSTVSRPVHRSPCPLLTRHHGVDPPRRRDGRLPRAGAERRLAPEVDAGGAADRAFEQARRARPRPRHAPTPRCRPHLAQIGS
jgi:hypothetical protein